MNQQKAAGIVSEVYFKPKDSSWVIIHECESFEEVARHMFKIPAFGIFDVGTEILADFNECINGILENIQTGEDIMPGGTVK